MAGGSTHYSFQGSFAESIGDLGINKNEFDLRHYNPQIGRWTGSDPYDEFASPYVGMGNNPVNTVDPDGGDILGILGEGASGFLNQAFNAAEGFVAGAAIGTLTSHCQNWLNGGLIGAGATLIGINVNWGNVGNALSGAGNWMEELLNKPEILRNIVIFIPKPGEEYANNFDKKNENNWHIIVKDDLTEANKALQNYRKKTSLDNIVLDTHGTNNTIVWNKSKSAITENILQDANDNDGKYRSILALQKIGNSLTNGGNLVLLACNLVKNGDVAIKQVACLFNNRINVFGSNQYNNATIGINLNFVNHKSVPDTYEMRLNSSLLQLSNVKGTFYKVEAKSGKVINLSKVNGYTGNLRISSAGITAF